LILAVGTITDAQCIKGTGVIGVVSFHLVEGGYGLFVLTGIIEALAFLN
jgi:hypothetical protein